jgi:hypothetical protein
MVNQSGKENSMHTQTHELQLAGADKSVLLNWREWWSALLSEFPTTRASLFVSELIFFSCVRIWRNYLPCYL